MPKKQDMRLRDLPISTKYNAVLADAASGDGFDCWRPAGSVACRTLDGSFSSFFSLFFLNLSSLPDLALLCLVGSDKRKGYALALTRSPRVEQSFYLLQIRQIKVKFMVVWCGSRFYC